MRLSWWECASCDDDEDEDNDDDKKDGGCDDDSYDDDQDGSHLPQPDQLSLLGLFERVHNFLWV